MAGRSAEGGFGHAHKALGAVGAVWAVRAGAVRAVGAEGVWAHIGSYFIKTLYNPNQRQGGGGGGGLGTHWKPLNTS